MPKTASPLPPLALMREYFEFSPNGIITLRKKRGRKDTPGDVLGSQLSTGYLYVGLHYKRYLAHRLVFYHFNGWCPEIIDHKDRNRKNNHPDNLRPATDSQNKQNGKKRESSTTSKFRGVYWFQARQKWISRVFVANKTIHVGCFDTELEAYAARQKAVKKYHGEFASNS
jgi:HNH endonuclease